jgi:VanZ family protein
MPSLWHLDKIGHFAAYGSLFTLTLFSFQPTRTRVAIFLLAIGLGITLEWLQSFVPGREMSALDALTNTVGLIFGIFTHRALNRFLEKRRS